MAVQAIGILLAMIVPQESGVKADNYTLPLQNRQLVEEIVQMKNCNRRRYLCSEQPASAESRPSQCFCDTDCHLFHDCCADVATLKPALDVTPLIKGIPADKWRCLPLRIGDTKLTNIQMVALCPGGPATFGEPSYLQDVPVMDSSTGVWYRNIYCAHCHGATEQLAPLNLSFKCSNGTKWDNMSATALYESPLRWSWEGGFCVLHVTPPHWPSPRLLATPTDTPGYVRPCAPALATCPPTWLDKATLYKCRSYSYLMVDRNSTIYHNPHCAICNGQQDLKCHHLLGKGLRSFPRQTPSLSIVMDFQWSFKGEQNWQKTKCSSPYGVFDPIGNRCQRLIDVCNGNYHFKDNKCIPNNNLNSTCPKKYLLPEQFIVVENGSLLQFGDVLQSDAIFDKGSYEVLQNGTAVLCLNLRETDISTSERDSSLTDQLEGILTCVSFTISIVCLILHITIYTALPKLRNLPGRNLLSLSWCLLLAQILFLFGAQPIADVPAAVCVTIAAVTHFFFLAAFFWMNVMSFDIWRKFTTTSINCSTPVSLHRKYAVYAWCVSGSILLLATLVDLLHLLPEFASPNYGREGLCWIGSPLGLGIFFGLPVTCIMVSNLYLFTTTVVKLKKQKRESSKYIKKKNRSSRMQNPGITGRRDQIRVYLYIKLFLIMGLSWLLGLLNSFLKVQLLWFPFIVLNGLQGAFIFLMFDCKRSVLSALWERTMGARYQLPDFLKVSRSSAGRKSDTSGSTTRLRKISSTRSTRSLNMPISMTSSMILDNSIPEQQVMLTAVSNISSPPSEIT